MPPHTTIIQSEMTTFHNTSSTTQHYDTFMYKEKRESYIQKHQNHKNMLQKHLFFYNAPIFH